MEDDRLSGSDILTIVAGLLIALAIIFINRNPRVESTVTHTVIINGDTIQADSNNAYIIKND